MIHEMRVYHCVPGKLPALLDRFERITLKIWERFGIRQAGFWATAIGESNHTLIYLLAWERWPSAKRNGTAFMNDPEWQAKRAETEANGPLLTHVSNQILQPTAFSSVR
jgi:hypothetical protein